LIVIDPLNAFGIDVFVSGNWEPTHGPNRFKRTMAPLKRPVIRYNFHKRG